MSNIGAIILAAGESSRLGRPKQLLPFFGTTLIGNVLRAVQESAVKSAVLVSGAYAELIKQEVGNHPIPVIHNSGWRTGIASSIRTGLDSILQTNPLFNGVILLVSDQPFVTAELLNQMIAEKNRSGKAIIACAYQDTLGTPVLFDRRYFKHLMDLKGQEGAKKLLTNFHKSVASVPFHNGEIDIDTEEDYKKLS
ncbi:nucleotidyltransferase family protein [Desertivirga xinjiangensis]|uniref:nucleotidyltransferase family protein n=1 Tax=Desertivirga xinjiangensis TaxID=539206 RepID=UPI00210E6787|nr:nucleotidyltransferase family protein [Pedobacter xinjiangensis]